MKTKLTLITLIACAAAGTAFAADPVVAFRTSSGTTKNSSDATYVGNTDWGADSKALGEKYFSSFNAARGLPFSWDADRQAFYMGDYQDYSYNQNTNEIEYYSVKKYWSFDAVIVLDGNASFVNEADATLRLLYSGDKGGRESDYDYETGKETYAVDNENIVLLAGTAKFTNAGTLLCESENPAGTYSKPPVFSVYMINDAVFENTGKIGATETYDTDAPEFNLADNAKLVNAVGGELGNLGVDLYGNAVFENAGTLGGAWAEIGLRENAKIVNTGTFDTGDKGISFEFSKGDAVGTAKVENRGTMNGMRVDFEINVNSNGELPTNVSASFENYGRISVDSNSSSPGFSIDLDAEDFGDKNFERYDEYGDAFKVTLAKSDLNVKNFGTIDFQNGNVAIPSHVKTTLAEGSRIIGDLSLGEAVEIHRSSGEMRYVLASKEFLSVVLTGNGGTDPLPLVSGNLALGNLVEFGVSFAEDAVKKTKYELTLWGGELTLGENAGTGFIESSLSGTLEGFGTTYTWNLDTATGVLTASADPVRAFRASSGTTTNSIDAVYIGNDVWGADSKTLGEKFFADLAAERGMPFEWDESKKAFYTGIDQDSFIVGPYGPVEYYDTKEYLAFDVVFALDGNASFVNEAGATLTFRYSGDKIHYESDYDPETGRPTYSVENCNLILLAGTSKFSNAGTLLCESEFVSGDETGFATTPPHFEVYLRDEAVFENSGKLGNSVSNGRSTPWFILYGDSKFVNTATGEIAGDFVVELYGNSVFENAGTFGSTSETDWFAGELELRENAKFVNRGTFGTGSSNAMKEIFFAFQKGDLAGTAKFENRGKMSDMNINFNVNADGHGELPTNLSASFENYGTISVANAAGIDINFDSEDYPQIDDAANVEVFIASYRDLLERSDLNVKNFGTISAPNSLITLDSGVKLTLGEGSNIDSDVAIGTQIRYYYDSREFRLDKDVLNIVLTGKGGSDALISGGLEVCNLVELNVSLAEDAVKKTKYELTIWGGELTLDETDSIYDPETGEHIPIHHDSGFIKTTGTLEGFGTTYTWSLDTATGVLTAKDVNIGEEIDLTSPTQNVELGEKDVATLDPSLTKYSGNVSGAGQVSSSGDVEFSGDASALTGTLSVDAGTFTIAESAKLGEKATLDVAGTLALEGARTIANATSGAGAIELAAGATVKFAKEVGVKTLNVSDGATLRGGVKLTRGADAVLTIAGTLALDVNAGEKVTLGGGKVVLAPTAKLDLGGNAASGAAQTQTLFADATNAFSALGRGATVTIFEGGNVEGDAVAFLATDSTLSALASQYAVIYDKTNGLTVRALTNPEAFANGVDTSDLSASFIAWSLGDLADELETLPAGFTDAAQLGALGGGNDPLLNALLAGDAGTARSILDRLSPKSYAAMIAMPVETFHDDARNVSARLAQRRFEKFVADAPWEFFAQAQMISVDNDTASDAPTFDFDRYGVFAGADFRLDETTLLGLALGAGTGDADIHNGGGKIESDDYRLTAFGGKTLGENAYVNAGAQIGFSSYDVKRTTDYGSARGETDGWNAGAFAEAGVAFAISETHGLYATPYVGLAYTHAEADSFKEDGGKAAFDADALEGDSLRARIGCAFSWGFDVAGARWRVGLDAAYSRELLDDEIDVDVTASDGSRISETAAALPEDVFSIGPTLNVDVSVSASIYAGYAFNAGTDSSTTHSANVGFRMRF